MEKVKMDKVRRLLGNRYTEEGRQAVMSLLDMVLTEYVPDLRRCTEENATVEGYEGMSVEQIDLASKCLTDLVTRASKEPTIKEVEDSEE